MCDLTPAWITGIAGIVGVLINIIINISFRISDGTQKKRVENKIAFDTYYLPLSYEAKALNQYLLDYENVKGNTENLLKDLNPSCSLNVDEKRILKSVTKQVSKISEIFAQKPMHIDNDYKLLYLAIKIREHITVLEQAINIQHTSGVEVFPKKVYIEFEKLTNAKMNEIYSDNCFKRKKILNWKDKISN
jgi:hypothetical protein